MAFVRCIRRESALKFAGLPLWSVALGPDLAKGEMRGHAKGILAFGDVATGVFAAGGLARGFFAFGGLAIGLASFGGLGLGLIVALGGAAAGGDVIPMRWISSAAPSSGGCNSISWPRTAFRSDRVRADTSAVASFVAHRMAFAAFVH